ncbi:hypothetical protein HPB52_008332 [Rhipicephalus sanguineus]|uniref:Uncharacterized protein n=1 Tax=Rhipicephalus sanguineus TaxID=34632 RepID=A0A9D4QIC8_RHISA|nr:hypothetical protein HPB52_008332 [Rhipicephalus sanguineus]
MCRSTGRRCRSDVHVKWTTKRTTKSKPPFQPTCRYSRGALLPLGDYEKFLKEHRRFYDGARRNHEGVVASTTDAASKGRRGFLEEHDRASWLCPQWVSSTGFKLVVPKTILDRKVAAVVRRHRHVATTNTRRRVCGGAAVNSELPEAYARHLSLKMATKTSGVQEVVPGDATTTGGSLNRRSAVTSKDDVGIEDEPSKPKTPLLEVEESGTAEQTDVCEVSAAPQAPAAVNSGRKDCVKPRGRGQRHRAASVKFVGG